MDNGLHLYDLTAARAFPDGCVEDTTAAVECANVWRGRLGTVHSNAYVDGVSTASGRHFLAVTSGSPAVGPPGVELLEVTNPLAPVNLKPGGGRFLNGEGLYGVALWEHAGRVLLALATPAGARIYDLSGCLAGGCTTLAGRLTWSRAWTVSAVRHFVTDSFGPGGRPYLYFGNENMCGGGLQREWLFDAGDPAAPVERGSGTVVPWPNPGQTPDPYPLDYWAWYYAKSPTGFSFVMPRSGRFAGNYFYRAAWTILDVHELVAAPPTELLFADGFESGDLSAWSASSG